MLKFLLLVMSLNLWSFAPALAQTPSSQDAGEQVEFIYDAGAIDVPVDPSLSPQAQTEITHPVVAPSGYYVPLVPSQPELMTGVQQMAPDTLNVFLSKKQAYLQKVSAGLIWLKLPFLVHNKILNAVNDQFYRASTAVAEANRVGMYVNLEISLGFGLKQTLATRLRATRFGSFIPEQGGFYFLFGLGFGLSRSVVDGKIRWSIEGFTDLDRLKKVKTALLIVGASAGGMMVLEKREDSDKVIQLDGSISPLGVVRSSSHHLGYSAGLGVALPPYLTRLMAFDFRETRRFFLQKVLSEKILCEEAI